MKKRADKHRPRQLSAKLLALLGSRYFFFAVALFFFLQMAWIALSAIYPMLFDEEYHLGIIEIYSRQLGPFIASQPPEAAFHGDITRYSSYFFHYLMSFPYRFITLFTSDLTTTVIIMRFLCIGMVMAGFWLFRKVLLNFGLSRPISHGILLIFTLIPLVPFALAQINYDSLLFLLVPLMIYLSQAALRTSEKQAWSVALLLGVSCVAVITKFTALPIVLGCVLFVAFGLWRRRGSNTANTLARQYLALPRLKLILTSCFVLLSLGLVTERYALNIVSFRALEPACDRLHSTDDCLQYTVFRRNETWRQNYEAQPHKLMSPIEFTKNYWAPHIFGDFFVTAAFVYEDKKEMTLRTLPTDLQASAGNRVLITAGWVALSLSLVLLVFTAVRRNLKPAPLFGLTFLILIIYASAHWMKNYSDYLTIGSTTAAQGRYYIPLLILVLACVAVSLRQLFPSLRVRLVIFAICLLLLTQGGGVANYMLYSNKGWYWSAHEQTIEAANKNAQRALRSFTPL